MNDIVKKMLVLSTVSEKESKTKKDDSTRDQLVNHISEDSSSKSKQKDQDYYMSSSNS